MIRLRPLRPREKRNVRHWAMELVVVVVGVLIALWAAEWVSNRNQHRSDALAIETIRAELAGNIGIIASWRSLDACHATQLAYLRDRLVSSDGNWEGVDRRAAYQDADSRRVFGGFYILPTGMPEQKAWEAALAAGVVDRMDAMERTAFGRAYGAFSRFRSSMEKVAAARTAIGALAFPGRLSDTDRYAALNSLIEMDGGREYISRDRHFIDYDLTERERKLIEAGIKGWDDLMKGPGTLKPCYTGAVMPDIFNENRQ